MLSSMAASVRKTLSRSRVPAGSIAQAAARLGPEPEPAASNAAKIASGFAMTGTGEESKRKVVELGPESCRPASSLHVKPDK
jgi:hypothetical protein